MTKEEIIQFLKEEMLIEVTETPSGGYNNDVHREIRIYIAGEEITSDYL